MMAESNSKGIVCRLGSALRSWPGTIVLMGVIAALVLLDPLGRSRGRSAADELLIRQMVGSEELILELTPQLGGLAHGLMNLELPTSEEAGEAFADSVTVLDIQPPTMVSEREGQDTELGERQTFRPSATPIEAPSSELAIWRALLDDVSFFDNASFRIVKARFPGDGFDEFEADVKFSALARRNDGRWVGLSGKVLVAWARAAKGEPWKIDAWKTKDMRGSVTGQRLFSESLDQVLPNRDDLRRARRSIHQEESVKYYRTKKTLALSHDFSPTAMNQKPAVTVGDVDGDGFDDLYIMVRLGKNMLLRNRGDGTFEERAADFEIAVRGNTTCSLFADFDNDGDQDLVLGRALERCVYYENAGGWFRAVSQEIALPNLAVSLAAADYNGDGLLDLHVSTYRPGDVGVGFERDSGGTGMAWPERFLEPQVAAGFRKRFEHSRSGAIPHGGFLDQTGPPNVLLANAGGGQFRPAPEGETLKLWKNTLQATWGDYDGDGDPDLYVANDWSSDHLFRNDGDGGFVDVAKEVGTDIFGFAMGASWGDYDNDGRQDLYVSNMYSKAGRRIMAQVGGLDPDLLVSAEGNYLYRQTRDGKFEHVSGLDEPALLVADAGWSWGGQFADFDNDADLDLYSLSGYFTAPEAVASEVDL